MNLSKYFKGVYMELQRSQIHFADYNPRKISEEEHKAIKRGIKNYGLLGGLIVNQRTGFTIVQGHQRISCMDELEKYDPVTKENGYSLRMEVIDVDLKTEKILNVLLNNPNAQGKWDSQKLAQLIPDIDYKEAGLTEADLSLLGVDYFLQTEDEQGIANQLNDLMSEVNEENEAEKIQRQAERQAERAAKVAHMKEVKQQVKEAAQKSADAMDAYVMLSFDNMDNRNVFLQRFGYPADSKFIKGEDFDMRCEVADNE